MASKAQATSSSKGYKGRPLGRILIKMGKVNRKQVHEALAVQKAKRGPIGQILIDLGYIQDVDLQFALAGQIGMEQVNLDAIDVPDDVIKLVSNQMANTYRIVPVDFDESSKTLGVAMTSPDNFQATDDLRKLLEVIGLSPENAKRMAISIGQVKRRLEQEQGEIDISVRPQTTGTPQAEQGE